jgi:hypothetical protein
MKIAALLMLLFLSGCGLFQKNVEVYDRQLLSKTQMNFIPNPVLESSVQHMLNAREGSVGGFGGAGGGCGCN